MSRTLKVAVLQREMGKPLDPSEFDRLSDAGVKLASLPEYFFLPDGVTDQSQTVEMRESILSLICHYSRRLNGTVVGGTLVEEEAGRFYNSCHIYDRGNHIGYYRKINPMPGEKEKGIAEGESHRVFEIRGLRLGILICADVLSSANFDAMAKLSPDVIVVPTESPYLPNDSIAEKQQRDREIFMRGAGITSAYILKTCGVGNLMGNRIQGRSLICDGKRVIIQAKSSEEEEEVTLITELSLS